MYGARPVWHVSVSVRLWGEAIPRSQWRRQIRREVVSRIERLLSKVGQGRLMWEDLDVTKHTLQCRRHLSDAEMRRLPQHKLPEFWTEEDERAVRLLRTR